MHHFLRERRLACDSGKSKIHGNKIGSTRKVPGHLACCITTCPRKVPLSFPKHDKSSITYEDTCGLSKRCFARTLWLTVSTCRHPFWCLPVYNTHVLYCNFWIIVQQPTGKCSTTILGYRFRSHRCQQMACKIGKEASEQPALELDKFIFLQNLVEIEQKLEN